MRYYSQIPRQLRTGPWTLDELALLHAEGAIGANTPCESEDGATRIRYQEVVERGAAASSQPPPPLETVEATGLKPSLAQQAGADLKAISPHLFLPWQEFTSGRWLRQRRALAMAFVGLVPLAIIALGGAERIREAYWAVAIYFSILWGVFFYFSFPSPGVSKRDALYCFFGSALSCTLLLFIIYRFTPVQMFLPWVRSSSYLESWIGFVGAVGLAEELSKALILMLMFRKQDRITPQGMMFYGLMAGLGFGIYEGVGYQFQLNWRASEGSPEGYYLLNVLRLTSLPFLHAVWTGIAGYFIGVARLHPERKAGLWVVAIGVPAVLHGTYNTFSSNTLGLLVALFSVLTLHLYLSRNVELERLLRVK
ncbi:MAG: PrsW family intramembrane metalloprotease [Verrucomicrobia bacterium]|nr:PrsW family intramembrane metalloprotease [Verrucomicrobiota bacterium]